MSDIGDRIKKYRKLAKLTQKQLGTLSKTSETTIKQYEAGKRQPRLEQLKKIANALHIPYSDLIGGEIVIENLTVDLLLNHPGLKDTLIENCIYYWGEELTNKESEILHNGTDEEIVQILNKRISKIVLDQNYEKVKIYENDLEMDRNVKMNTLFFLLNDNGQEKALEQIELLTKIPEYQKNE